MWRPRSLCALVLETWSAEGNRLSFAEERHKPNLSGGLGCSPVLLFSSNQEQLTTGPSDGLGGGTPVALGFRLERASGLEAADRAPEGCVRQSESRILRSPVNPIQWPRISPSARASTRSVPSCLSGWRPLKGGVTLWPEGSEHPNAARTATARRRRCYRRGALRRPARVERRRCPRSPSGGRAAASG